MAGSITSVGIGSSLGLQDILDQLKEAERQTIRVKEAEKDTLTREINAYNSLNAKIFAMKSHALSLSLESNFLKNNGTVSDEDILSVAVDDGIQEDAYSIEVIQKAQQSVYQTAGQASEDAVFSPEATTTITSEDEIVTTAAETMTIEYGALGEEQNINISLSADMSLKQVADAINESANNQDETGLQLVSASVEQNSSGNFYIRLSATDGGNSAESQISVSDFDYVIGDTTIVLGLDDGSDPAWVSLPPGATLNQTADLINNIATNPGITASIIDDGTGDAPFRLVLTSDKTGEDNRIQLSSNLADILTAATGSEEGDSLNAIFKVNGITYNRQSNIGIKDVISGVSLTLKKAGETSLGIQKNTDSIKEDILGFVSTYNDILNEINGTSSNDTDEDDSEDEANPLADSFNVKSILQELRSLANTAVNIDSDYTSLVDLGLEVNKDGSITIDEEILDQALASDPDAIQSLFIGDADKEITGLGDILNDGISKMVGYGGSVTTEIDSAEKEIERLEADIIKETERVDKKFEIMTQRFIQLDSYIRQLNSEAAFMASIFESYTKASSSSN